MSAFASEKCSLLLSQPKKVLHWRKIFGELFRGGLSPEEIKTLLLLIARRGEGSSEIWQCLEAVRRIEPPRSSRLTRLIDVSGTGGDGLRTFNISTVSSFVIAGAGGYVAKHGNRAVSSQAGSSDLMEALGVRLDVPFKRMLAALQKFGLCYFHAPFYHPSFAHVQKVRRELGVRTFFNMLGPLVNPLELRYQIVGVSNPAWAHPMAEMLKRLGRRRAAVLRSVGGLDELSTHEPSDILLIEGRTTRKLRLNPKAFGFRRAKNSDYRGGSAETNKKIALQVLEGRGGACEDVVLLNSGFALWLMEISKSIEQGIRKSLWAIHSGRAMEVLENLRQTTREKERT